MRRRYLAAWSSGQVREIAGAIDDASAFEIRGWAANLFDTAESLQLEVLLDNFFLGSVECSGLRAEARSGRMLPYVIELDGHFCGQLTIGNVTHGALRSAWIGYWVPRSATGGGVATAALALGLDHCFGPVMLHRVEATVRPENAASRAVLAKVGFRQEGLLQRYLEVDKAWRDHLLMAITVEEVTGSVASTLVRSGNASWV